MRHDFDGTLTATGTLADVAAAKGLEGNNVLNLEIENTGSTNATTDFAVLLKDHPAGEWYSYLAGAEFDEDYDAGTQARLLFASATGPHELAAAGKAHIIVRLHAAYGVKIQVASTSGTTVAVRGTIRKT